MLWTPTTFNLLAGHPFEYSGDAISLISGTDAFDTGIDIRDAQRCVIGIGLLHCHIVPKGHGILVPIFRLLFEHLRD